MCRPAHLSSCLFLSLQLASHQVVVKKAESRVPGALVLELQGHRLQGWTTHAHAQPHALPHAQAATHTLTVMRMLRQGRCHRCQARASAGESTRGDCKGMHGHAHNSQRARVCIDTRVVHVCVCACVYGHLRHAHGRHGRVELALAWPHVALRQVATQVDALGRLAWENKHGNNRTHDKDEWRFAVLSIGHE
jgi:hypothetical protein